MSYRETQAAALARIASLEAEVARLQRGNDGASAPLADAERELARLRAELARREAEHLASQQRAEVERARLELEHEAEQAISEHRAQLGKVEAQRREALQSAELEQLRVEAGALREAWREAEAARRALEDELDLVLSFDPEKIREHYLALERASVKALQQLEGERTRSAAQQERQRGELEAALKSPALSGKRKAVLRAELEATRAIDRALDDSIAKRRQAGESRLQRAQRALDALARRGLRRGETVR